MLSEDKSLKEQQRIAMFKRAVDMLSKEPSKDNIEFFFASFDNMANFAFYQSENHEAIDLVITHLPTIVKACSADSHSTILKSVAEALNTWLSKDELFQRYIVQDDAEKALAWLCVYQSFYEHEEGSSYTDSFESLLSKWTERVYPSICEITPQNVVSFLYGNSCWECYFQTYDEFHGNNQSKKFVNRVVNGKFPVIKRTTYLGNTAPTASLPTDML